MVAVNLQYGVASCLLELKPVSIGRPVTRGLGYSSGPSMASEAGTSPEGQLDRHTVAVDFLLSRSRALEDSP